MSPKVKQLLLLLLLFPMSLFIAGATPVDETTLIAVSLKQN